MEKESEESNVGEEVASVTAEQNLKAQEAVLLVPVQSGLLETGVRYIYSLQEMFGRPSCRLGDPYKVSYRGIPRSIVVPKPSEKVKMSSRSSLGFLRRTLRTCRIIHKDGLDL